MARIRGTAIRGLLRAVKERGWSIPAVVAAVRAQSQPSFAKQILVSDFYPYTAFADLMAAIEQVHGGAGPGVVRGLARDGAKRDLGSTFKILLSLASMEFVVQRAQVMWARHCDTGQCVAVGYSPTGYEGEVRGLPDIDPLHCLYLEGWLEGLAEGLGAEEARTTHSRCVHRGDPVCGYTTTWTRLRRIFG